MSNLLQINPKKRNTFVRFCLILGLCIGTYYLGTQSKNNPNMSNLLNAKDEIIFELNNKYNKLVIEHEKSQALIKATTDEVKRLAHELKEYKNNPQVELIFNESNNNLGVSIVSDHIKANEAFSSMAYCDSDDFTKSFIQNLQDNNISVNLYSDGKHFSINAKEEVSKCIHLLYDYDSPYGLPRKRALAMLHLYYCQHNR